MPILAERGYLIPAIDTDTVDYLGCAIQLARSIRQWHPDANISVISVKRCDNPVFNHVIPLPYGDLGGFANDWQCFAASPYRQTIKLEADMVIASPVDHWWTMFEHQDLVISTGARDFYDQPADSRYYRKTFDANHLPDVYNAITYWRVSRTAQEFFQLVRNIFENWTEYKTLLKFPDENPTTDLVYAMAAQIIGPELVTLPFASYPKIVHMKRHMIASHTPNWTQELVWENNPLRFNTVAQWGAVHYHQKDWRSD
ncbi:MAG: hypothetical protein EBU08_13115 [Micrococcales bacterium]|nr:hypothetical protein [Micrococcales bacterium]